MSRELAQAECQWNEWNYNNGNFTPDFVEQPESVCEYTYTSYNKVSDREAYMRWKQERRRRSRDNQRRKSMKRRNTSSHPRNLSNTSHNNHQQPRPRPGPHPPSAPYHQYDPPHHYPTPHQPPSRSHNKSSDPHIESITSPRNHHGPASVPLWILRGLSPWTVNDTQKIKKKKGRKQLKPERVNNNQWHDLFDSEAESEAGIFDFVSIGGSNNQLMDELVDQLLDNEYIINNNEDDDANNNDKIDDPQQSPSRSRNTQSADTRASTK